MRRVLFVSLLFWGLCSVAMAGDDLAPPERLSAGGQPIDVEVGHAAPYATDWDGDGATDLLVGQFADGRLHVHRSQGKVDGQLPVLAGSEWFRADGEIGTVPAG
jgi:hypothetical protein